MTGTGGERSGSFGGRMLIAAIAWLPFFQNDRVLEEFRLA
jgi:hypothetical protein